MFKLFTRALLVSASLVFIIPFYSQNWHQNQKVLPPIDPTSPIGGQSDRVGWAVASDGDVMVAGAPDSDVKGSSSGAAFVYERVAGEWQYVAQLSPDDGAIGDNFGWSLDVSGTRIAVGAPGDSPGATSSGSVYVFDKIGSDWLQTGYLAPADPSSFDQFGYSVSVDGDRVLASSFEDDDNGFSSGSAYIFKNTGGVWSQEAKLIASDGAANDYFGISVSLDDSVAVCGAYLHNAAGTDRGAAYVYYRNNGLWSQNQKLTAPDAANSDQFGVSVAVSGSRIAIGANYEDDGGTNAGAVYTFSRPASVWTFSQKLLASDAAASDFFGHSLSLDGADLVIGAYGNDDLGSASGSAYVYTFSTSWALQQKVLPPDGATLDYFGFAVGVSGNEIIIGARGDDDSGNDSGSIYIFSRSSNIWSFNFKGTANDMIDDPSLDLFGSHVALDGFNAIVGSYGDDDYGVASGSVRFYRFDGNTWVDEGKFYSSDIAQEDFFGFRVAISGNTALVSSYGDDDLGIFSGSVYVFERTGGVWTQNQKLLPSDGAPFDDFGYSLSIDGNFAVISSYLDDDFGNFSGSAYVFQKVAGTWVQTQKLLPSVGAANQQFGFDVDISGAQIVIGARNDGTSVTNGGAAYIYEYNGASWTQAAKIKPSDNTANKVFGSSVSISNGIVIVGAIGDNTGELNSGAAYVFEKVSGNWSQLAKLKPDTIIANEYFGYSVDNNGKKLLIGAYRGKNEINVAAGSAFLFNGASGAYVQEQKLTAADGLLSDYFGIHVALDGKNALIGAQFNDQNGENAGAAYFFADCADLDNNGICDFAESSITNNECENATNLTPSVFGQTTWYEQSLFGATESAVGCVGVSDDDVWFKFTAQSANDVIIAQDPDEMYDVVVQVFETCASTSLDCFDNYGAGAIERAMPGDLVPGQEYYYRIYDAGIASDPSTRVRTQVKTFEDAKLRTPAVGVFGYGFKFQEQGGGLSYTVQHPYINGFYLQLNNVPGLEYGKTYEVSVQHLVAVPANGIVANYWSDFGTICTISMEDEIPLTQIRPQFCTGAADFYLADQLLSTINLGADKYRFTFTGVGGTDFGNVHIKESTNYAVFLHTVGTPNTGLKYGNTYDVTVQTRVEGIWSDAGPVCTINMSVQPPDTEVKPQYCNGTYLFPQSNFILAQLIHGASQYEWRFTPSLGGSSLTQMTNGVSFAFHMTSLPFVSGTTYNVQVRVLAGGIWGDYGSSCPLTIQANPIFPSPQDGYALKTISDDKVKVYPNPFSASEIILDFLQGGSDAVHVNLRDMTGRILFSGTYSAKGEGSLSQKLFLPQDMASGQYLLILSATEFYHSLIVIKE